MPVPITIAIPVGPSEANQRWLHECFDSILMQDVKPDEVLVIDDQAHMDWEPWRKRFLISSIEFNHWKTPWLSGVAHAFNFGVAMAKSDLVIMLGSDDELKPWAVEDCWRSWTVNKNPLGYYYLDIVYSETGETQSLATNAAMVHKNLWNRTGGFPPQSAMGRPDTIFVSMLMVQGKTVGELINVESKAPPYFYRSHPETETNIRHGRWEAGIMAFMEDYQKEFTPPLWSVGGWKARKG